MEKIIRTFTVLVSAFIFLFVLFFIPASENVSKTITDTTPAAPVLKVAVSVQPRKHEQVQYLQEEWTVSEQPQTELQEEVQTYIGTYLDADSSNEDLVFPEIDLQKVYSRVIYPAALKRKNIEALFTVRVFVNKNGTIKLSFPDEINSAFVKAIEKAFDGIVAKPAVFNGEKTDVTFTIPFVFELI